MSKSKTTISICGKEYCIVSDEPVEYIHRVAAAVQSKIQKLGDEHVSLNSNMLMMLSLLNVMDECIKHKEALFNLKKEVKLVQDNVRDLEIEVALLNESERQAKQEAELRGIEIENLNAAIVEKDREIASLKTRH